MSSDSDLEKRIKRLEDILYSLGEVLKAGTTATKEGWEDVPKKDHFEPGELEKILYNLGDGLTADNIRCPPWCGGGGDKQMESTGDEQTESTGDEKDDEGSQEETT